MMRSGPCSSCTAGLIAGAICLGASIFFCACSALPLPNPAPLPGSRWNPDFDIGAAYWNPKVSGNVRLDSEVKSLLGFRGTKLDLPGDLGFDRKERLPTYFAKAYLGRDWRFDAEYLQLGQSGNSWVGRDLLFGSIVSPLLAGGGTELSSELDTAMLSLKLSREYHTFQGFTYGYSLGLMAYEGDVSSDGRRVYGGQLYTWSESDDWRQFAPVVGAFWSYETRNGWHFGLDASGTRFEYSEKKLITLDGTGSISYFFSDNFCLYAGYRYLNIRSEVDEMELQYRILGPLAGFMFRF